MIGLGWAVLYATIIDKYEETYQNKDYQKQKIIITNK